MIKKQNDVTITLPLKPQTQQIKWTRRWKQLSRLQRALIYISTIVTVAILIVLQSEYSTNQAIHKKSSLPQMQVDKEEFSETKPIAVTQSKDLVIENQIDVKFNKEHNVRQKAVIDAFKHAWKGYKTFAWGMDNLKPVSEIGSDWFGLGLTIVDSLDTAFIMGLSDEYNEGKKWVMEELTFTKDKDVNLFEVTIRVLGSLLANYHLDKDELFLKKAIDLGDRLLGAFSTKSGIPFSDVNLATTVAHGPGWSVYSSTAEVTSIQLEFRELSRVSGNPIYEKSAANVSEIIHKLQKRQGLVPIFINPNTGEFNHHVTITLGARGDSYYEYLLKQWLQTGKTINYLADDYIEAMQGVKDLLAKRSFPNKYLFIGELSMSTDTFNPKMDHLVCFLPGTLALGADNGMPEWHLKMAEELIETCYMTYKVHPTFLAPEITHFNLDTATKDMYTKIPDAHSLLRPEFVESLWYLYQITGNKTYQDWGWNVFQAFEKHAKVKNGYTSLHSVKHLKMQPRDMMESFFLSETLKYLYLLFSDNRFELDLRKFVLNTEAHPLPIHSS